MTEPTIEEVAGRGHNSGDTGGIAAARLKSFIERIENLEREKEDIATDIKEFYKEASGAGFDTKTMKRIIKLRKMDSQKRREEQELLELYASAIGIQGVLL